MLQYWKLEDGFDGLRMGVDRGYVEGEDVDCNIERKAIQICGLMCGGLPFLQSAYICGPCSQCMYISTPPSVLNMCWSAPVHP